MATSDVCEKIVSGNNIKSKDMITIRVNGSNIPTGGCEHHSTYPTTDNDLQTEMETKLTDRFDEPSVILG